jgi:hypothetical protein
MHSIDVPLPNNNMHPFPLISTALHLLHFIMSVTSSTVQLRKAERENPSSHRELHEQALL